MSVDFYMDTQASRNLADYISNCLITLRNEKLLSNTDKWEDIFIQLDIHTLTFIRMYENYMNKHSIYYSNNSNKMLHNALNKNECKRFGLAGNGLPLDVKAEMLNIFKTQFKLHKDTVWNKKSLIKYQEDVDKLFLQCLQRLCDKGDLYAQTIIDNDTNLSQQIQSHERLTHSIQILDQKINQNAFRTEQAQNKTDQVINQIINSNFGKKHARMDEQTRVATPLNTVVIALDQPASIR